MEGDPLGGTHEAALAGAVALGAAAGATPAEIRLDDRRTSPSAVVDAARGAVLEARSIAPGPRTQKGARSARLAGASRTTLAEAIAIALRRVPGEALRAEIELENEKPLIEVKVFADGRVFEVEIDGRTSRVLEVEEGDEEDNEEDQDEEDALARRLRGEEAGLAA